MTGITFTRTTPDMRRAFDLLSQLEFMSSNGTVKVEPLEGRVWATFTSVPFNVGWPIFKSVITDTLEQAIEDLYAEVLA